MMTTRIKATPKASRNGTAAANGRPARMPDADRLPADFHANELIGGGRSATLFAVLTDAMHEELNNLLGVRDDDIETGDGLAAACCMVDALELMQKAYGHMRVGAERVAAQKRIDAATAG